MRTQHGKIFMVISSKTTAIEAQIRECYARSVWTTKTHEKCADILNCQLNRIKFWQIIISAVITTGILVSVFGKYPTVGILSAALSFILTIINSYLKQYDLGGLAQKHADAAIAIWNIRENYLSLLTDMSSNNLNVNDLIIRRDALQKELVDIYRGSPRTFKKAYKEATKGLKELEELTFSDEEIDKILPLPLRKTMQ